MDAKPRRDRFATMGMGLVISQPMRFSGTSALIVPGLDRQELTSWLLLWDRLAWPRSAYFSVSFEGDDADEQFLMAAGVLTRPTVDPGQVRGDLAQLAAMEHVQAFVNLEKMEPGAWALAQGTNSFLLESGVCVPSRGALVELYGAIPVPDARVPLDDILQFKARRRDELIQLRDQINSLYEEVNNADDVSFALKHRASQIDHACTELVKVSKECKFPFRIADLKCSFDANMGSVIKHALASSVTGYFAFDLSTTTSTLTGLGIGALSAIRVSGDIAPRRYAYRTSPYRYVYHFHDEIF